MNKECKIRKGFTLAEVLITLTVIGVVAALTIPSLLQSYQNKQFDTAAKKAKSILVNGYKMMVANEENTSFNQLPIFQCKEDFACLSGVHKKLFKITSEQSKKHNGLPKAYTKSDDSGEAGFKWDLVPYIFTTNDGMTYGYIAETGAIRVVVDTNGEKAPNKICTDMMVYQIYPNGEIFDTETVSGEKKNMCETYLNSYTVDSGDNGLEEFLSGFNGDDCSAINDHLYEMPFGSSGAHYKVFGNKCVIGTIEPYDDIYTDSCFSGVTSIQVSMDAYVYHNVCTIGDECCNKWCH